MKISLKWLESYIAWRDRLESPQELADLLTRIGLEVDEIQDLSENFENVVVGNIIEKGQHPDADKLTLCQVSTGNGVVHQIVCGAKNHNAGDNVVVALPGAVLPGDFKIKGSKIRGVESQGMLCSESELGLSEEADGIMILPADAPVGEAFSKYSGLDDALLEVNVTSNRSDCLSHFGLAREIGTALKNHVEIPFKEFTDLKGSTKDSIALHVEQIEMCPRYAGRLVQGVKVGPSPSWMKMHLENLGVNSINNIVDITNFVMLELGQPLHAFDVREIKGNQIRVDLASKGEKFQTLDGTEIELDGDELMIRDGERPVALAGIVGGLNSGIQDDTTEVFIEAAYFTPEAVRRTAKKFGIETDSSYRFSRGTDPEMVRLAMDRAASLMQELAGGTPVGDPHDCYPNPIERPAISIGVDYLEQRLGFEATDKSFEEWLTGMGCEFEKSSSTNYTVRPPSYRPDISIKEDLVEEYGRLEGYDKIPDNEPLFARSSRTHSREYYLVRRLNQAARSEGFQQSVTYAFTDSKFQSSLIGDSSKVGESGLMSTNDPIKLLNPLSSDLDVMRTSLAPGLLQVVNHNVSHGLSSGRIFETGYCSFHSKDDFQEEWRLGLAAWGSTDTVWKTEAPLVLRIRESVENILRVFGGSGFVWKKVENPPEHLHPGQSAVLFYEGKNVGYLGTLHPRINKRMKLREDVVLCELNLDLIMQGQPRVNRAKTFSKFPFVDRDIALVVGKDVWAQDILTTIKKTGGKILNSAHVFDVYEGQGIGENERSIAFRLIYQGAEGTLTDEEVNATHSKIVDAVCQKWSAKVR